MLQLLPGSNDETLSKRNMEAKISIYLSPRSISGSTPSFVSPKHLPSGEALAETRCSNFLSAGASLLSFGSPSSVLTYRDSSKRRASRPGETKNYYDAGPFLHQYGKVCEITCKRFSIQINITPQWQNTLQTKKGTCKTQWKIRWLILICYFVFGSSRQITIKFKHKHG